MLTRVKGGDDSVGVTGLQSFQLSSFDKASPLVDTMPKKLSSVLEQTSLPYITSAEQIRLAVIVDCMSEVFH